MPDDRARSAARAGLIGGPGADGLAAELLWRHICHSLGQLPSVAGEILESAVSLTVLPVDRRFEHDCAMVSSSRERCVDVGHPDPDKVRDTAGLRWAPLAADVSDYHSTVAPDGQLRPMALANTRSLHEVEGGGQKGHGRSHVGIERGSAPPWPAGPSG